MDAAELSEHVPSLTPYLADEDGGVGLSLRGMKPPPPELVQQLVGLDVLLDGAALVRLELYDAAVTDADLKTIAGTIRW